MQSHFAQLPNIRPIDVARSLRGHLTWDLAAGASGTRLMVAGLRIRNPLTSPPPGATVAVSGCQCPGLKPRESGVLRFTAMGAELSGV